MQHRLQPRIRVQLPVRIYLRGQATRRGQLTDLSREGAFLAVRWNDDLPRYQVVEIALMAEGQFGIDEARFPGLVIHRQPRRGVGLMFMFSDAERNRQIEALLRRSRAVVASQTVADAPAYPTRSGIAADSGISG